VLCKTKKSFMLDLAETTRVGSTRQSLAVNGYRVPNLESPHSTLHLDCIDIILVVRSIPVILEREERNNFSR
jgi:hypothetical protein